MTTEVDWRAFIAVLAAMPDLVERLMAAHTPTLDGRWCKGCTTPGRGTPHGRWPCVFAVLAAEAARAHPGSRGAPRRI
jgi:hypothetical protein